LLPLGGVVLASEREDPLEGLWLTQDQDGVIQISPCDSGLCGWITGMDLKPGEKPPRDVHGNSQCGLPIIAGLLPTGHLEWQGRITDPRDGRVYDVRVTLDDTGRLRLRGYVLVPLFGATQTWTPYKGAVSADCRMQELKPSRP
jgi:uncharacterized protein (DUF2147 family)